MTKGKIYLMDKIRSVDNEIKMDNITYHDDDEYYDYGYYDKYEKSYEYITSYINQYKIYKNIANIKHLVSVRSISLLQIDIESSYSTEMLRQKKIDTILGLVEDNYVNTLSNFFLKILKYENRNL